MAIQKCSNCGAKISKKDDFCPDCGHKITVENENVELVSGVQKSPKKWLLWVIPLAIIGIILAGILVYSIIPRCGDGKITSGEDCSTCAADVKCSSSEICKNSVCVTYCGNSICDSEENYSTCPPDCPYVESCGNGKCGTGETYNNCPADCPYVETCGNGVCGTGETCNSCEQDCEKCKVSFLGTVDIYSGYEELVTKTGDTNFKVYRSDIVKDGLYVVGLSLPFEIEGDISNIKVGGFSCIASNPGSSGGYELVDDLVEHKEYTEVVTAYYGDILNLSGSQIDFRYNGDWQIVMNTGSVQGREIVSAKDTTAVLGVFFLFNGDESKDIECRVSILSSSPASSDTLNFEIEYRV